MPIPDQVNVAQWVQLGFAVAVAVYLLTKMIPRMEERADKRDASFIAALERRDADAAKAQSEERQAHRDENHLLAQQTERNTERIIEAVEVVGQEVRVYTNGRGRG